jgi:hypothetical protein
MGPQELNGHRIELLLENPSTTSDRVGVLVTDEYGTASGASACRTSAGDGWPTSARPTTAW